VTATDQDEAAERSARELERRLRMILPPSLLAYAFATAFKRWEMAHDWRCWPKTPHAVEIAKQEGAPPAAHADELEAVRKACETASDKIHRKETP
jgi:imidazolonepropionase-like amidohydrolase